MPAATPQRDPQKLVRRYVAGSLIVLLICITISAMIVSGLFIRNERERSHRSLIQFSEFFRLHYRPLAEEMWVGNYSAIGVRVAEIAKQFGNSSFELKLADQNAHCVYAADSSGRESDQCEFPSELIKKIPFVTAGGNFEPLVQFDRASSHFIYLAPIFVADVLKGYIYGSLSDPYQFFHGNYWDVVVRVFNPTLAAVLFVWFLWLFFSRNWILRPYLAALLDLEKREALSSLAAQVAHDIRSPLAALDVVCADVSGIQEEKRIIIRSAVARIRDIANNLLDKNRSQLQIQKAQKSQPPPNAKDSQPELLSSLVETLVSEKRIQNRERHGVRIDAELNPSSYGLFAHVNASEFKRCLSNLIDNSLEAISESGFVTVTFKSVEDRIHIRVADNGKGISPNLIPRLGQRGETFGKEKGTGLGLFYVKKCLENWGGKLKIDSEERIGTVVTLDLPRAAPPAWFVPELRVEPSTNVVVIDDDASIHNVWEKRFQGKTVNLVHYSDPQRFLEELPKEVPTRDLFLIDYEFIDRDLNGIDLIEKASIARSSILVTSRYTESEVQKKIRDLGLRIIPKELAAFVPVHWA